MSEDNENIRRIERARNGDESMNEASTRDNKFGKTERDFKAR
jgi:hypothetical protein